MCCWYIQEELDIEQFENNVLPLVVSKQVHISANTCIYIMGKENIVANVSLEKELSNFSFQCGYLLLP